MVVRRMAVREGSIPAEFGGLAELYRLDLKDNLLTGSIPSTFGNLTKLKEFSTYCSQSITGSIPTEFGKLGELRSLRMSHNALTGSIPSELGDLPYLHDLLLNSNQFGGCIPRSMMDISTNDLSSPGMPGYCPPPASEQ